jgi:hypothetical protein
VSSVASASRRDTYAVFFTAVVTAARASAAQVAATALASSVASFNTNHNDVTSNVTAFGGINILAINAAPPIGNAPASAPPRDEVTVDDNEMIVAIWIALCVTILCAVGMYLSFKLALTASMNVHKPEAAPPHNVIVLGMHVGVLPQLAGDTVQVELEVPPKGRDGAQQEVPQMGEMGPGANLVAPTHEPHRAPPAYEHTEFWPKHRGMHIALKA